MPKKTKSVATISVKSKSAMRPQSLGHVPCEIHENAAEAPLLLDQIVQDIRSAHRRRRFGMKIQQKLDRALESFIRVNATEWSPDMDEKERVKINALVKQMIKDIRVGKSDLPFAEVVAASDEARAPADKLRNENEKKMEQLAETLPIWPWCEAIHGIGALGVATIVAETGNLSNYPNPAKVWKRLGYAPFGREPGTELAGSTWRRETWRPHALTAEEWTDHPFSPERYALMFQIAYWLRNAQWISKTKTESGKGEPKGEYGKIYGERYERTKVLHPDWPDGRRDKDAIRIMMKAFLRDLHLEWKRHAIPIMEAAE